MALYQVNGHYEAWFIEARNKDEAKRKLMAYLFEDSPGKSVDLRGLTLIRGGVGHFSE